MDLVPVPASYSLARDVSGLDEVGDDSLRCALRDPNGLRDIAQAYPGVAL
jgi:hypothetical protein